MRKLTAGLAAIVAHLMILGLTVYPQQNDVARRAQAAYEGKSFPEGASLFLLAAQFDPKDASLHLYNAACCFALMGQKDLAFYSLEAAIAKGWRDRRHTQEDPDLVSLRGDPRWNDLLVKTVTGGLESNLNAIINGLNNLAVYAYEYRLRRAGDGKGQASYTGLKIPADMGRTAYGTCEILILSDTLVLFKATSAGGFGTIEVCLDSSGRLGGWQYAGAFAGSEPQSRPRVQNNRDALINDLNNLAAFVFQYRIRPTDKGGGNGSYGGFKLPDAMAQSENGSFICTVVGPNEVRLNAVSGKLKGAAIEVTLDGEGRLKLWTYSGEFR